MLTARPSLILAFLSLLVTGWVLGKEPVRALASETAKSSPKNASAAKKSSSKAATKTRARKTKRPRRRPRRSSYRSRIARLRIKPERVEEIQKALIAAGYLSGDSDGKWGDATSDAMRRFQEDHGFPTTGLPEARTLMKLGLGPHPLPPELDPTAQVQAEAAPPTQADSQSAAVSQAPEE